MFYKYCDAEKIVEEDIDSVRMEFEKNIDQIIYVGDPMCSWCWGISPQLKEVKDHYQNILPFTIIVGGLRPGGGEPWNKEMENFLKHHWEEVREMSGQPFGYKIFDRAYFNYDTEPACRAVVAARPLLSKEQELEFFESIQRKFYVDSEDPGKEVFYKSLCNDFQVSYEKLIANFRSEKIKKQTYQEFQLNRQWGVRGYPSVLLITKEKLHLVTNGYATFESMKKSIDFFIENRERISS